ncbi:hypothetical protein SCLCIDRAFT_298722 [Scleroderma citrinum Foug A]|uniref:Uncharacterized protein n=1 Tax=Scleroderma citrinum Foug A TaxID=1036808 RepID=A0A0C3D3Q5_9AGAM|nr:hypothetical protein SCLCIDRAFT_298722 [Scleroderma citrinum Foug A]
MIVGMGAELDGETVNDGRRNGAAGPCNNTISNLVIFGRLMRRSGSLWSKTSIPSRIRQVKTLQARCMGRCINA